MWQNATEARRTAWMLEITSRHLADMFRDVNPGYLLHPPEGHLLTIFDEIEEFVDGNWKKLPDNWKVQLQQMLVPNERTVS
jgi:hypothetical protein